MTIAVTCCPTAHRLIQLAEREPRVFLTLLQPSGAWLRRLHGTRAAAAAAACSAPSLLRLYCRRCAAGYSSLRLTALGQQEDGALRAGRRLPTPPPACDLAGSPKLHMCCAGAHSGLCPGPCHLRPAALLAIQAGKLGLCGSTHTAVFRTCRLDCLLVAKCSRSTTASTICASHLSDYSLNYILL